MGSRRGRQREEKGIHELKRGIRKKGVRMAEEKREQEKETMDKTTSALLTSPNLHKLVHQVPLCGGVLASIHVYIYIYI